MGCPNETEVVVLGFQGTLQLEAVLEDKTASQQASSCACARKWSFLGLALVLEGTACG